MASCECERARISRLVIEPSSLASPWKSGSSPLGCAFPRGTGRARARIKEFLQRRIASQPLELPNAGSVFRNPPGDYAARLIESCGLKGRRIGGAQVSPKHANFIVNVDRASAADIEALIDEVRETVKAKYGVELEREVKIIGERA
jgi:UDP-N-acetylmuramate dehydrogenase